MGKEYQAHFGQMISNIAVMGTWHLDLINDSLWFSDQTKNILEVPLSYTPDVHSAIEFYIEEHRPIISRILENAIEHGSSWDVSLRIKTAKGRMLWVRSIGYALKGEDGTTLGVEGIFQDVDELISLRTELEEYQQAVDLLSQVMVSKEFYDRGKNFEEALKIGTEYLGFELGMISYIHGDKCQVVQKFNHVKDFNVEVGGIFEYGKTYCSLVYQQKNEVVIENMGASDFKGHPACAAFPCEAYMGISLKVKGSHYGALNFFSRSPMNGKVSKMHRKFLRFLATWVEMIIERHDLITEYARNFEMADSHRARFEAVFEDAPLAMLFIDPNHKFLSVNRSFTEMFGYTNEDIIGKSTQILYADTSLYTRICKQTFNAEAEKNITPYRVSYLRKNGESFESETVGDQIRDSNNKLLGFVGIIKDLTDQIETEKLIARQNRELEKERALSFQNSKMAALGQMAGGVAHEINNPLTIIEGFSKNLLRKIEKSEGPLEDKVTQKTLEKILNASERISKIVQGLKTFARDDSGDDMELVSVKAMVTETLSFCEQRFKNNGVELILSELKDDWFFKGHGVQISQVLLNLLNNSFDAVYVDAHSVAAWIKLSIMEKGNCLEFRVVDSGNGIQPEILKNLMEPFFTTKEVGKGTGLGLSISQSIIERHEGRLQYELFDGQTSFTFSLPKVENEKVME